MKKIVIILIFILGVSLRLLFLGDIPSGFFRDEAALGYNAYSIWETGKDEFGESFPLFFRSFEVYFLPLYVYLSAPFTGIFGLNEFSSRLLSALSGSVALLLIYFIGKELKGRSAGIFAMFILAISPWHIYYSRGAFEGNLALTLFAGGFLYLIYFLKNQYFKYIIASGILFTLSMYSYQAERAVLPVFAILAFFVIFKKIKNWKAAVAAGIISFIIFLPLFSFTFQAAGIHRASGVSLFNSPPPGKIEGTSDNFLNNDLVLRSRQIAALYLSYYSPRNLFFLGDYDPQRSVTRHSVFFAFLFPMLIAGILSMKEKISINNKLLVIWILAAPVPAALTGDPFHTYRSLLLYFPLTLLMGIGADYLFNLLKNKKIYIMAFISVSLVTILFFIYDYAVLTPGMRARNWDYGYKEIYSFTESQNIERVVIHDIWTEAYIHYLFFAKVDPVVYHNAVYTMNYPSGYYYNNPEQLRPDKVGKYEFRKVDWPSERGDSGTVFVFDSDDLPESEFSGDPKVQLLKEIYYPDGKSAYRIVKIK